MTSVLCPGCGNTILPSGLCWKCDSRTADDHQEEALGMQGRRWGKRGGRPKVPDKRISGSMSIPLSEREWLLEFGEGSVSRGVSKAIAICRKLQLEALVQKAAKSAALPGQKVAP